MKIKIRISPKTSFAFAKGYDIEKIVKAIEKADNKHLHYELDVIDGITMYVSLKIVKTMIE